MKRKNIKWNPFIFKELAIARHGSKYDYSLIENIINKSCIIKIICPIHGMFKTTVKRHLLGNECRRCGWDKTKITVDEFIEKVRSIFNGKYDYRHVKFDNVRNIVSIVCPLHGVFRQKAYDHMRGHGCYICGVESTKLTTEDVLFRFINIHADKYDYSKVIYINNYTKVDIICSRHGLFKQLPYEHMRGHGCPKCRSSIGEKIISRYLELNNIPYNKEYKIPGHQYRYDFHIPSLNILIEYDGIIHYKEHPKYPDGWLSYIKRLDNDKNILAAKKGYKLLRVNYKEFTNINMVISNYIKSYFPYRYNNVFYKNSDDMIKENRLDSDVITERLSDYETKKQLEEKSFSVAIRNDSKRNTYSQSK